MSGISKETEKQLDLRRKPHPEYQKVWGYSDNQQKFKLNQIITREFK